MSNTFNKHSNDVPISYRELSDEIDNLHSQREKFESSIVFSWFLIVIGGASALGGGASDFITIGIGGGLLLLLIGAVWQISIRQSKSENLKRSYRIEESMRVGGWSYNTYAKTFSKN